MRSRQWLAAWLLGGVGSLLSTGPAQADYVWRLYRAGDGLAGSLTRTVTVSPRGSVWVQHGGVDALSVLDGYQVRRVPSPGGRIQRIYQSRAGLVWSTYEEGLQQFVDEQWRRHPIEAIAIEQRTGPVRPIRQTPVLPATEDRVLILLSDRLIEFRALSQRITELRRVEETALGRFLDLTLSPDDDLWISGEHGLIRFAGPLRRLDDQTPFQQHLLPPALGLRGLQRPLAATPQSVTCVADDPAFERRVIVHFDAGEWHVRRWPGENPRFAWPGLDPDSFWASTFTRLAQLRPGIVELQREDFQAGQYFDVALEGDGVFWLATSEGLVRCAPAAWRSPPFEPVRNTPITAALEDADGALWFVAGEGLVENREGAWSDHPWPDDLEAGLQTVDRLHRLSDGRIALAAEDQVWLFDPLQEHFQQVHHPDGRRLRKVLQQTADGALIIHTLQPGNGEGTGTLERYDGTAFTPWPEAPPLPDFGRHLHFLARAANGDLWLGGSAGPALWRDGQWYRFGHADGYADDGAMGWIELPDGRIWCGGLARLSEFDGRRWTTIRSGLDRLGTLAPGIDGSLWLATGSGLHRHFNGHWIQIDVPEGLPASTVHCLLVDRRGRIWAGTSRGLSLHHPRADIDPPITLEPTWESVRDPRSDTTIRVSFQGRDKWRFTPDDRLLYSYRLDEGEWSAFLPDPSAVLPDLAPGRRRLEVRAMDRNWNIQHQPTSIELMLVLPWYRETRVVYIGIVALLAVAASLALAIHQHLKLRRSYAEVGRQVAQRTAELEHATEALAQSQKMTALGTLTAGIAHDFNNLLSIIKGSAQIIAANLDKPDKVRARLDRIQATVNQAGSVIHAMLGFGRTGDRRPVLCEANRLVDDTLDLLGDRFRREIQVSRHLAPDLPPVRTVPDLIRQALLNLILNAAESMRGSGEITLTTRLLTAPDPDLTLAPAAAPAYAEIAVHDRGCGIAPEIRSRIFEPFFTTKAFSSRHGTGLGLYMVYEFAREMGLGLRVQSRPGEGSTFALLLPVPPPPDTANSVYHSPDPR